jgi:hypothetical protein
MHIDATKPVERDSLAQADAIGVQWLKGVDTPTLTNAACSKRGEEANVGTDIPDRRARTE